MRAWGLTHIGMVREVNQDTYIIEVDDERSLALVVVCDGMGGHKAGDVAANLAAGTFAAEVWEKVNIDMTHETLGELASAAITAANDAVNARSDEDTACFGMGTTLVSAIVSGNTSVIINVGDSRAYFVGNDEIERLTRDHSVVEDMMMQGDITLEEARQHPSKNLVTRVIGGDRAVEGDVYMREFSAGDILLLCSDGLTNFVDDREILYEVRHGGANEESCARLVELANSRGGRDNITVAVLEF